MEITFEKLPQAISELRDELQLIKELLLSQHKNLPKVEDELLTVNDAAKFLSVKVPTIYSLISKGALPVMKRSKRNYFSKIELIEYLKDGRKKTSNEINNEVDKYLASKIRYKK